MDRFTRRTVLKAFGAVAGAAALGNLQSPAAYAEDGHVPAGIRFGVQLNAFPIDPKNFASFMDALAQVKQIGYQGFESSFRNVSAQFASPSHARTLIEQTGLTFFGVHIFLATPNYDQRTRIAPASLYEGIARGGASLGTKHLILSGAPAENEDQLKWKIEGLNQAGRFAKSVGITAAYHNHWPEFESKLGEIEALYTRTDPSLVSFVLDAGHAYRGGANLPVFIRAHAKRIVGFHLRDYRDGKLVTLGTGTFPLAEVAHTIEQIGWKGWVENEEEREDLSKNGTEVVAPAYKAMKEAFSE